MAALRGPDDETWKSMSPLARKVYWAVVLLASGTILVVWLM
ncbi:hypothetical protein [Ralstonia chuxiongensis]|nr:hypothetical protein [Ralstonia chuxiongensis]CAJ0784374.1 hypothetical protein R8510_05250 [Ralstonia chuxiongensis]